MLVRRKLTVKVALVNRETLFNTLIHHCAELAIKTRVIGHIEGFAYRELPVGIA